MSSRDEDFVNRLLGYLAGYVAIIVLGVSASLLLTHLGLTSLTAPLLVGGLLFLWAASRHPPWLFDVVRRVGWFGGIRSDIVIRRLLVVLAVLLLGIALWFQLRPQPGHPANLFR